MNPDERSRKGDYLDSLLRNDLRTVISGMRSLLEPVEGAFSTDMKEEWLVGLKVVASELTQLGRVAEIDELVGLSDLLSRLVAEGVKEDLNYPLKWNPDLTTLTELVDEGIIRGVQAAVAKLTGLMDDLDRRIGPGRAGKTGTAATIGEGNDTEVVTGAVPNLLEMFKDELNDLIERFATNILNLETAVDEGRGTEEIRQEVMRAAHSLKGSAKMVGVPEVGDLAHRVEDIMKDLERNNRNPDPDLTDMLLSTAEIMRENLQRVLSGGGPPPGFQGLLADLNEYLKSGTIGTKRRAASAGDAGATAQKTETGEAESKTAPELQSETIRVDTTKLDNLLNLMGEVLVLKISLEHRLLDLERLIREAESVRTDGDAGPKPEPPTVRIGHVLHGHNQFEQVKQDLTSLFRIFSDNVARLDILTRDLRDRSLEMRMIPASALFDEFRRTARGIARQLGKDVKVTVEGAGTEVDRRLLEEIRSPMIHLIRNSLDHGIEPPDLRQSAGKPAAGSIRLNVSRKGSNIVIEFEDDGVGIDPEKVKRSAVEKGIIEAERAEAMNDSEARYLIFQPGFSTSEVVTDVSGRGVGMDVVKAAVDSLRGQVLIQSELGKHTRFILTFPQNLSTVPVLMVESAGEVYAVPLAYIQSIRNVEKDKILREGAQEVIDVDDEILPLVELGTILGSEAVPEDQRKHLPVVILRFQEMSIGVSVDRFLGQQETIVKPLGRFLGDMRYTAGATILDSGDPALVLEVADIFDTFRSKGAPLPTG